MVSVFLFLECSLTLFENYHGVPNSTAILFFFILLFWLILTKTGFGRHIYAVGGNSEAARRAGINVTGIRIAAFTLCSTLAVVGGILAASRETAVASQVDPILLLELIGAAVMEVTEGALRWIAVTADALVRRAQARSGRLYAYSWRELPLHVLMLSCI